MYLSPVFLLVIVGGTIALNFKGYIEALQNEPVARRSLLMVGIVFTMLMLMIAAAIGRWSREGKFAAIENEK
jgi:hypothetical protein